MGDILGILFFLILLGVFIAGFLWPEETKMFGERWRYKEEPQFSELDIFITQLVSFIGILAMGLILFFTLLRMIL